MTLSAFFNDTSDVAERVVWKNANAKSQCSIGIVTGINASPVSVNIQPLVNYFDQIQGYSQYPELKFIPIAQMQQTAYSINLPVNVGDTGIVLWFDREVYTTLAQAVASPKSPESGDMMNVSACVFIPILPFFPKALPLKTTGVDIMSIGPSQLTGNPMISLLGELIALVMQLTTYMGDMSTFLQAIVMAGAGIGPTDPVLGTYPAALSVASTSLNTQITTAINLQLIKIQNDLTTFLGSQP